MTSSINDDKTVEVDDGLDAPNETVDSLGAVKAKLSKLSRFLKNTTGLTSLLFTTFIRWGSLETKTWRRQRRWMKKKVLG